MPDSTHTGRYPPDSHTFDRPALHSHMSVPNRRFSSSTSSTSSSPSSSSPCQRQRPSDFTYLCQFPSYFNSTSQTRSSTFSPHQTPLPGPHLLPERTDQTERTYTLAGDPTDAVLSHQLLHPTSLSADHVSSNVRRNYFDSSAVPRVPSSENSPSSPSPTSRLNTRSSAMSTSPPDRSILTRPSAARGSSSATVNTIRPSSIIATTGPLHSSSEPVTATAPDDILTPQPRQHHILLSRGRGYSNGCPEDGDYLADSSYLGGDCTTCQPSSLDPPAKTSATSPIYRTHSSSAPPELLLDSSLCRLRNCHLPSLGYSPHKHFRPQPCAYESNSQTSSRQNSSFPLQHTSLLPSQSAGTWDECPITFRQPGMPSSEPEIPGRYFSQPLHLAHSHVPKETNVLNSRFDPISGSKRINQYVIIDELGRGVHGKVKLGQDVHTGQMVAIKIVERAPKRKRLGRSVSHSDKIRKEIAILKKARHLNIVGLIEVIDDPAIKKVYLVLEYVEMGEVRWRVPARAEIALVEYRRFLRESGAISGLLDDPAAIKEDQAILNEASKHYSNQRAQQDSTRKAGADHSHDINGQNFGEGESKELSFQNSSRRPSVADVLGPSFDPQLYDTGGSDDGLSTIEMAPGMLLRRPSHDEYNDPPSQSFTRLRDSKHVPDHFKYVPLMTLDRARRAFRDSVLGVEYLHYQGIIHRDIKPANLLETKDGVFKISDFGVSYLGRNGRKQNGEESESDFEGVDEAVELAKTVGTPAFYAPELCNADENAVPVNLSEQIDIWALGVMLYCFVYGRVPFHDHNTFVLMRMIAKDPVILPKYRLKATLESDDLSSLPDSFHRFPHEQAYEPVDKDLRDLLGRLLIKDPTKRCTIGEIKKHPWFTFGIENPEEWFRNTDPSNLYEGKKIEVSSEDVVDAVVPLSIVERVASVARRIGDALGVVRDSSRRRRDKTSSGTLSQPSLRCTTSHAPLSQPSSVGHHRRPDEVPATAPPVSVDDDSSHRALHGFRSRHILTSRSRDLSDARGPDRPRSAFKGLIHDAGHKILRSVRSREGAKINAYSGSTRGPEIDHQSSINSAAISASSSVQDSNLYQPYLFSGVSSIVTSPVSSAMPSRTQSVSYGNDKTENDDGVPFPGKMPQPAHRPCSHRGGARYTEMNSPGLRPAGGFEDSVSGSQGSASNSNTRPTTPGDCLSAASVDWSKCQINDDNEHLDQFLPLAGPPSGTSRTASQAGIPLILSSSSEDCMTSDVSHSMSYPSISSALSQRDMKASLGGGQQQHHNLAAALGSAFGGATMRDGVVTSPSSVLAGRRIGLDSVSLRAPIHEEDGDDTGYLPERFGEGDSNRADDESSENGEDRKDLMHRYRGGVRSTRRHRLHPHHRQTASLDHNPRTFRKNSTEVELDSDSEDGADDDDCLYIPQRSKSQLVNKKTAMLRGIRANAGASASSERAGLPASELIRATSEGTQKGANLRRAATVAAPSTRFTGSSLSSTVGVKGRK